jgi:hypothetical protein
MNWTHCGEIFLAILSVVSALCWIFEWCQRRADRAEFKINPLFDRRYSVGKDVK